MAPPVHVPYRDGKAFLVDPKGNPVQVDEDDAGRYLGAGYTPDDPKAIFEREKLASMRADVDSPLTAAVSQGLNVATMGITGAVSRGLQGISREDQAKQEAIEASARPGARLVGTVGGIFAPGGIYSLASRGARAVGGAAAKAITGGAAGAAAKVAQGGIAGGLEGTAAAAAAVAEDYIGRGHDVDGEEIAKRIVGGTALGTQFGTGFSLLGATGSAISRFVKGRGAEKAAMAGVAAAKGKASAALSSALAKERELADDAARHLTSDVRSSLQKADDLERLAGEAAVRARSGPNTWRVQVAREAKSLQKEADDIRRIVDSTKTSTGVGVRKLEDALDSARSEVSAARDVMAAEIKRATAASLAKQAELPVSERLLGGALGRVGRAGPLAIGGGAIALQALVGDGEVDALTTLTAMSATAIGQRIAGSIRPYLLRAERAASRGASRVMAAGERSAPLAARLMTQSQYADVSREIEAFDDQAIQDMLDHARDAVDAFGLDPQRAQDAVIQKAAAMRYLQESVPQPKSSPGVLGQVEKKPGPTTTQRIEFGLKVRAALNPGSLLDDLALGKLTPEAVNAWETLYPQQLEKVRELAMRELKAAGSKPLKNQRRLAQFDLLMGKSSSRNAYLRAMQDGYAKEEELSQSGGSPSAGGIADATMTSVESALRG